MRPGHVIGGRFEIEHLAGSGGMGKVFRAKDRETGGLVAIKTMRADEQRERFEREARVLAELRHAAIVRYVGHGVEGESAYLVMEWLEGHDLAGRIEQGRLTLEEALGLTARVADALAFAHRRGIVHRDVKPSNVFLAAGEIGRATLIDFGVARRPGLDATMTSSGAILGTPAYMAPEQAKSSRDVDPRADVWALGCVLYECLTGHPPFQGEHALAVLAKILLEEAPPVAELRPDVPAAAAELVDRMLAKDPSLRPPDGDAVAAALRALGGRPGTPGPTSLPHSALTGRELRVLSVLFVGDPLDGAAAASAPTLSTAAASGMLDGVMRAASSHGGRVEQLKSGVFIVSLTGTGAATDLAARAARCALALADALPDVPMALATGRAVVSERWPMGEVIDRGVRLLHEVAAAGARGARIDEVTAGLLDARFDVRGDGAGLFVRAEREASGSPRTLLGKPTPCVGREIELGALVSRFEHCVAEPAAQAVLVTAPAGVGKTRLGMELLQRTGAGTLRAGAPDLWFARGDPMSKGAPFGMLAQIVRSAAGVLEGEPLAVRRQKLRARAGRRVPPTDARRVAAFLGELCGTPFPDEETALLGAARRSAIVMGDQMRAAWDDFVAAECAVGPVLLVLEDLHWGDRPTVAFVESALRNQAERPLMALALARPEVHELFPDLWRERGVFEVRLQHLSRSGAAKLVRAVLGGETEGEIVDRLVERAAGNAFYLEELVRAQAEGKGSSLPETVLAMAQARLETLEPEARRVLRAASVFGQVFSEAGVVELLGGDPNKVPVGPALSQLALAELVTRREGGHAASEYAFRHAIVREAAYAMLTDNDRRLGHRLAGEWLSRAGHGDAVLLAEHFERGHKPERAAAQYRRAAGQALEGNDFDAAVAWVARGLACGADGELGGELRLLEAEARIWKSEFAGALEAASAAMSALPERTPGWYAAVTELCTAASRLGRIEVMHEHARRLRGVELSRAPASGREPLAGSIAAHVAACARIAAHLLILGDIADADALLEHIDPVADAVIEGDPTAAARVHQARGYRAGVAGNPSAHIELGEATVKSLEQAGNLRHACGQRVNIGFAYIQTGAYEEAEATLRHALAVAERAGLAAIAAHARSNLGLALGRRGAHDEALVLEAHAVEELAAQGNRRLEASARIYLAEIFAAKGAIADAERLAQSALESSEAFPAMRLGALATLADVLGAAGRAGEALHFAASAAELLDELGTVDEHESLVRLVHAEALHATGDVAGAARALAGAHARLVAGAAQITRADWRRSFLERVPVNARIASLHREWGLPSA